MKLLRTLSVLAILAAPMTASPLARNLIVTGQSDIQYHDWRANTLFLRTLLESTGRFEVRQVEEPRGLTPESLAGYDAAIVSYNGPRWGAAAEKALEQFVSSGKGVVTFHGVTYGPLAGTTQRAGGGWSKTEPWLGFLDMLGVSWAPANIGHAPRHAFTVKLT